MRDAPVGPCGVEVRLVVGQDSAQMSLAEDQHVLQDLAARGADKAFAGRVHARSLDSGPLDPGPGGLEDGDERGGKVRAAVADRGTGAALHVVRGSLDVASVQTGLGAEPSAPGAGAPALIARPASGRAKR